MRKLIIFVLLFVLFLVLFYTTDVYLSNWLEAPVQRSFSKENTGLTEARWNEMDKKLNAASRNFYREYLEKTDFNGAILVCRNGKTIFENYSGLTSVKNGSPIDSTTSFHLASVSKTFTAMAILMLEERGMLDIDDSVSTYLDGFPFSTISIKNLLSHRSGLPNYVHFAERMGWDSNRFMTNMDLLNMIRDHAKKLNAGRSGAYFDYCNTNYALLALIIEKVSKLSYPEFLEQNIFRPLGMNHTFVLGSQNMDMALPSFKFNNSKEPYMFLDMIYGDKNIYSTPRDMMKWDAALYENRLFKSSTLEAAFIGYSHEKRGIRNYGLGWRLVEMPTGKKIIYHNGWWHGNNTVFSRLPADSTAIIVLGNKFNRNIYQARRIAGIFEGYGIHINEDD